MYANSEWATNQHRDTCASHIGHYDLLSYFAVAQVEKLLISYGIEFLPFIAHQNDSIGRVRYQLLEKMLQPCGPPPEKEAEE